MHSNFLERAGLLTQKKGAGSLSMLTLSRFDEIAQGLAVSVESTVVLDENMSEQGLWPAVNCSSISHIPSPKFLTGPSRQLASLYKKYLGESREVSLHSGLALEFGLPLEDETRATLEFRNKLNALLLQREPLFWEEQLVVLFAGLKCDLEEIELGQIPRFGSELLDYMRSKHSTLLSELSKLSNSSDPIPSNLRLAVEQSIQDFFSEFDQSSNPKS
jgi:F-type H+-transporting ATPase subunit alpha